jgi:hypothetical protein
LNRENACKPETIFAAEAVADSERRKDEHSGQKEPQAEHRDIVAFFS